jgi:RimJ/RimL family protein N-acetyltransferase
MRRPAPLVYKGGMTTLALLPPVATPRLLLREMQLADAPDFSAFMTQPDYQKFIAMRLRDEAEVAAFVARCVSRQNEERRNIFHLAAEELETGEVIGDGFAILQGEGAIEIGWGLHPAMWSMGFGTEIGEALLAHAFERLNAKRAWCKVMGGNLASQGVARRLGMRHDKMVVTPQRGSGIRSVDVYSLTADQYFDRPY